MVFRSFAFAQLRPVRSMITPEKIVWNPGLWYYVSFQLLVPSLTLLWYETMYMLFMLHCAVVSLKSFQGLGFLVWCIIFAPQHFMLKTSKACICLYQYSDSMAHSIEKKFGILCVVFMVRLEIFASCKFDKIWKAALNEVVSSIHWKSWHGSQYDF